MQHAKCERGQSLVELGMSITFVFILLSGVVDLGRAFFTYMALRDAAQEGALYGSIDPANTSGIHLRVQQSSNLLQNMFNDASANTVIEITVLGSACSGNGMRVRVAYDNFPLTMPFIGALIGTQTIPISATVTDTIISPVCP
jgi:Flp pilus assembly protein TadG